MRHPFRILLALGLIVGTGSSLSAQDGQIRLTPFVVTGGFASDLLEENFTVNVAFPDINLGDQEADIVFDEGYEFDTFTGFGASLMWRRGKLGIDGSITWLPTRAVARTQGAVPNQIANAFGFEVDESTPTEDVPSRLKTAQNLVIPTVGVTYFFSEWQAGRPPPWEFYLSGSVGVVSYLDDEPIQTVLSGSEWDTPVLFSIGVGTQMNFTPSFGVRVDLSDRIWSTEIMGESQTQHAISFSPGLTFIL